MVSIFDAVHVGEPFLVLETSFTVSLALSMAIRSPRILAPWTIWFRFALLGPYPILAADLSPVLRTVLNASQIGFILFSWPRRSLKFRQTQVILIPSSLSICFFSFYLALDFFGKSVRVVFWIMPYFDPSFGLRGDRAEFAVWRRGVYSPLSGRGRFRNQSAFPQRLPSSWELVTHLSCLEKVENFENTSRENSERSATNWMKQTNRLFERD